MTEYVLGFCFADVGRLYVALITKARPDWQAGRLNGVGGRVEPGESPHEAMVREWFEETGTRHHEWTHFLTMSFPQSDTTVYCYTSFVSVLGVHWSDWKLPRLTSQPDEPVNWYPVYPVNSLPANILSNLPWLIPLAESAGREIICVSENPAHS